MLPLWQLIGNLLTGTTRKRWSPIGVCPTGWTTRSREFWSPEHVDADQEHIWGESCHRRSWSRLLGNRPADRGGEEGLLHAWRLHRPRRSLHPWETLRCKRWGLEGRPDSIVESVPDVLRLHAGDGESATPDIGPAGSSTAWGWVHLAGICEKTDKVWCSDHSFSSWLNLSGETSAAGCSTETRTWQAGLTRSSRNRISSSRWYTERESGLDCSQPSASLEVSATTICEPRLKLAPSSSNLFSAHNLRFGQLKEKENIALGSLGWNPYRQLSQVRVLDVETETVTTEDVLVLGTDGLWDVVSLNIFWRIFLLKQWRIFLLKQWRILLLKQWRVFVMTQVSNEEVAAIVQRGLQVLYS